MLKKLTVFVLLLSLVLVAVPVSAANYNSQPVKHGVSDSVQPVIYEGTIDITKNGGVFKVGFCHIAFKKDFIDADQLPKTFQVRISAVNGVPGIEFEPDAADFCKDVIIRVDAYKGFLYDETSEKNIYFEIKKQQLEVRHFSRYAFS